MKFYDIYHKDLDIVVKYKLLSPQDAFDIQQSMLDLDKDLYVQEIISRVIYNAYSDVALALKGKTKPEASGILNSLYTGAIMLNPALDYNTWNKALASSYIREIENSSEYMDFLGEEFEFDDEEISPSVIKKIPKAKILSLSTHLQDRVIGQSHAIAEISKSIRRHEAGLSDKEGPIGVFILVGPSGTGKTFLAKETHSHLYSSSSPIIRIDCGEYQQKHDVHKLIGAPPSYVGHDEGGQLANRVMNNPNSVILIDEIEKAHSDVWDIFLRVFEDGVLTDSHGREIDFSNTIIMMTTNLGNEKTTLHLTGKQAGFGARLAGDMASKEILDMSIITRYANEAIKGYFRTEFLNRIHKIIVFNPLQIDDLKLIADQAMQDLDRKLTKKGFVLRYGEEVTNKIAIEGSDSISNARGIMKYRKDNIDDLLTDILLDSKKPRGTVFSVLLNSDNSFFIDTFKPVKAKG